ncbi:MAG TPA: hypothetical protein VEF36_12005 [Roseiarcus sp.]|nr:hypothetical protein [Roseiarcus sp.]
MQIVTYVSGPDKETIGAGCRGRRQNTTQAIGVTENANLAAASGIQACARRQSAKPRNATYLRGRGPKIEDNVSQFLGDEARRGFVAFDKPEAGSYLVQGRLFVASHRQSASVGTNRR